jgi:hypothetical protein
MKAAVVFLILGCLFAHVYGAGDTVSGEGVDSGNPDACINNGADY